MSRGGNDQLGPLGQGALRGHAFGALITAFFGAGWMSWGLTTTPRGTVVPVAVLGTLVTVGLFAGGMMLSRLAARTPPETSQQTGRDPMQSFGRVVFFEWAGIGLAVVLLSALGQGQWIAAVICAGVGLHFLPLGTVFALPMYYVTGIAMCLVAATTMIAVPLGAPARLWQVLPGFGSAVILWVTSAKLLLIGRKRSPEKIRI